MSIGVIVSEKNACDRQTEGELILKKGSYVRGIQFERKAKICENTND